MAGGRVSAILSVFLLVVGVAATPAAFGGAPSASATAVAAGTFVPVTPNRVLDTNAGLGTRAPGPRGTAHLQVLGRGHVPASGVRTVVLTITVSAPAASGYLTVYADGASRPGTSNVSFAAGMTHSDQVYAPVGADGKIALFNRSGGAVRLYGDVTGYFASLSGATAGGFVPTTATVTAGSTSTVNAVLLVNGSTTGRVVAASGKQINFGGVAVYDRAGRYVSGAELSSTGVYTAPDIAPGSYTVCFYGGQAILNPPYGFVDECYDNVVAKALDVGPVPTGTTPVRVAEGATVTLNATLATAGGISGTVTRSSDGAPLDAVRVEAFDAGTGQFLAHADADANGHYLVGGLAPSATGYRICFEPRVVGDGYQPQCYRNVAWDGDVGHLPAGTTPVSVTGHATHTGIDAVIRG